MYNMAVSDQWWCNTSVFFRHVILYLLYCIILCCTIRSSAFLQPHQQIVQPCRTRIIYGLRDGEPETVQDAIDRFYRLENGLWIRPRAGRHKKLWKKSHRRIRRLKQHVFCNSTQCRLLDRMVNIEYKTPKYYVDDPYAPYRRKSNLPDYRYRPPKFLPWFAWNATVSSMFFSVALIFCDKVGLNTTLQYVNSVFGVGDFNFC